jgi:hypothetical protein
MKQATVLLGSKLGTSSDRNGRRCIKNKSRCRDAFTLISDTTMLVHNHPTTSNNIIGINGAKCCMSEQGVTPVKTIHTINVKIYHVKI